MFAILNFNRGIYEMQGRMRVRIVQQNRRDVLPLQYAPAPKIVLLKNCTFSAGWSADACIKATRTLAGWISEFLINILIDMMNCYTELDGTDISRIQARQS